MKTGDGAVKGSEVDIELVMTDMAREGTPVDPLPQPAADKIVLLTNPSHPQLQSIGFESSQYMKCLQTAYLGRALIYTPIIGSTQTMLTGNMPFCTALKTDMGVVCAAGQQTKGKGQTRHNLCLLSCLSLPVFNAIPPHISPVVRFQCDVLAYALLYVYVPPVSPTSHALN